MRKIWWLAFLGFVVGFASAQNTTVTGTLTDTNGTVWNGAVVTATFRPTPNFNGQYTWNGGTYRTFSPVVATANGSGVFTMTIPDNTLISPANTQWSFSVAPLASTVAVNTTSITIFGATQNITSFITLFLTPPQVNPTGIQIAYSDSEVLPTPGVGQVYFRTSDLTFRQWTGAAWVTVGGGGSNTPCGTNGQIQYNNSSVCGGSAATLTAAGALTVPNTTNFKYDIGMPTATFAGSIAQMLTNCLSYPCVPVVDPIYTGTDSYGNPANQTTIIDYRRGVTRSTYNLAAGILPSPTPFAQIGEYDSFLDVCNNDTLLGNPQGYGFLFCEHSASISKWPGWNQGAHWMVNQENQMELLCYSAGICGALNISMNKGSVGDDSAFRIYSTYCDCFIAPNDEGVVGVAMGLSSNAVSQGTYSSSTTSGQNTVITTSAGMTNLTTMGVGRPVIDLTTGVQYGTQTVTSPGGIAQVAVSFATNPSSCGTTARAVGSPVTGFTIAGGIITVISNNSYTAGQIVALSDFPSPYTYLNGYQAAVSATGLSSTQFQMPANYPNAGPITTTGMAGVPVQPENQYYLATVYLTGLPYAVSAGQFLAIAGTHVETGHQVVTAGAFSGGAQIVTVYLNHEEAAGATVCVGGSADGEVLEQTEYTLPQGNLNGYTIASNVAAVTGSGISVTAGQWVTISGYPTSTFLNGTVAQVLASPAPTSSGFSFAFTHSNVGPTSENGFFGPNGTASYRNVQYIIGSPSGVCTNCYYVTIVKGSSGLSGQVTPGPIAVYHSATLVDMRDNGHAVDGMQFTVGPNWGGWQPGDLIEETNLVSALVTMYGGQTANNNPYGNYVGLSAGFTNGAKLSPQGVMLYANYNPATLATHGGLLQPAIGVDITSIYADGLQMAVAPEGGIDPVSGATIPASVIYMNSGFAAGSSLSSYGIFVAKDASNAFHGLYYNPSTYAINLNGVSSLAMGSVKITGLANGSGAQDAAAFGQIPTALSQLTGYLQAAQEPAHTGDCTNTAGSLNLVCTQPALLTSLTNIATITGPNSGTGSMQLTAGTGLNAAFVAVGSSGANGYFQGTGSLNGTGQSGLVGGTTATSTTYMEPDSGLSHSTFQVGLAAGGGSTGYGQTYGNLNGSTNTSGYFNDVYRFSLWNTLLTTPAQSPVFEFGIEACATSTAGTFSSTPCPLSLPNGVHQYNWTFTSATTGFGNWDIRPGPGVVQGSWTQAGTVMDVYVPELLNTISGGTSTATTITVGSGAGTGGTAVTTTSHGAPNAIHGSVTVTAGTLPNIASPIFTIASTLNGSTLTRGNLPDCTGWVQNTTTGVVGVAVFSYTTTTTSVYSSVSLVATDVYNATYTCWGN